MPTPDEPNNTSGEASYSTAEIMELSKPLRKYMLTHFDLMTEIRVTTYDVIVMQTLCKGIDYSIGY